MAVAASCSQLKSGAWRRMIVEYRHRRRRRSESLCCVNDDWDPLISDEEEEGESEEDGDRDQVDKTIGEDRNDKRLKIEDEDKEEDILKVYSRERFARELFQTLEELRDSCLLTDLTLSTEDGESVRVHSPVLAAVSSLVHHRLQDRDGEREKRRGSGDMDTQREMCLVLDPGVDRVGLVGVLEFAYTGAIAALNTGKLAHIQAAAHVLGVPRVLELCREVEEKMETGGGRMAEERKISAVEQMEISLQSIRQLWTQRVGCDVVLAVDGTSFHVHRVVLAASSDYFRGMFSSGMRESQQHCVTLRFQVASELEVLIGCSYSGSLPLSWGCVFEVSCTALLLQFQTAYSLGLKFLRQEMDVNSCLDVASFAETYGMAELLEAANDFVLMNFHKVSVTEKFQDLPFANLLKILRSPYLCVSSELVVFKAVVCWIKANPSTGLELAEELIKTIQFPLMSFIDYKEVKVLKKWNGCNSEFLYKTLLKEFFTNCCAPMTNYRVYLPKECLVLVGGDQIAEDLNIHIPSRELWFGHSLRNHTGIAKSVDWRKLVDMPEPPRLSHEVVVMEGMLYVVGGRKYWNRSEILSSVWRYNPKENSWQRLADMQERRCSFSLVVVDGVIYAIGGDSDPETNLGSVERYCPDTDSWSSCKPLDQALSGHSASVLDGHIYISGGYDCSYQSLVSMFLYHPEKGTTYLADINQPRALHCMEALSGLLYIAGGVTHEANLGLINQLCCEVYDPVKDSWSSISPLHVPHVGPASAVLEGKLYVLGGYSQDDFSESRLVHRYDPSTQRWENMGRMPGPSIALEACVIHLPAHFRQLPN